ncbi:MAG: 50S ribosomal protein L17 [Patescibacteria group bacterium]|nr:50S ribosomal protein L17 [Patescibacteria group bacterium]
MVNSLSRKKDSRRSLLRNLATSLILYEEITTTKAKAKEVKAVVEHLIAKAKKNNLASRRLLLAYLFDKNATRKVFEVIVPRYKKLDSGFILSYKLGQRLGDSASLVMLKLREGEIVSVATNEIISKKDKNGNENNRTDKKPAQTKKTSGAKKTGSKDKK